MDRARNFDAVVIGSSRGWAAKELTEKGLAVLMLERGKPPEPPDEDYVTEHEPTVEDCRTSAASRISRDLYARDYCGAAHHAARVRRDHPATSVDERSPTSPYVPKGTGQADTTGSAPNVVGGKSLVVGPATSIAGATSTSRPTSA